MKGSKLQEKTHFTKDVTRDVTRFGKRTCLEVFSKLFTKPVSAQKTCKNTLRLLGLMITFLTANEVCEWLRINRKALWELEKSRKLIPDRIGRRLRYRQHEVIEFLDCEREKQKTNYGRLQPENIPQAEDQKSSQRQPLGTGVTEEDLNEAFANLNPVSDRSIYTYIYMQIPAGTAVSEINAEFSDDRELLSDYSATKHDPNYQALGSAV